MLQVDVFTPLRAVLERAWVLWELTLLAEPLMVVAPTPGQSCTLEPSMAPLLRARVERASLPKRFL